MSMPSKPANADDGHPPVKPALGLELGAALEELRRARAEQKRLELMAKGLSGALREQADTHLETLDRLQRREEEALRRGEERFQLLLESAGEGIIGVDETGRVSFANPAGARMLDSDPAAMLDRHIRDVLRHSHDDARACASIECPLQSPFGADADGEAVLRAARSVPVEYTSTPIRDAGAVMGAVIVLRDATERRRVEEARERLLHDLEDSVRARDDFLSIASHELRTPLTPLRFQAHALRRALRRPDGIDAAQIDQKISALEAQIDRLERLIEQLLDVSRITIGRLELQREPVDLSALVRDVVQRAAPDAASPHPRISVDAPSPAVGQWDRFRIEQVVGNLVSNADKYGADRPVEVGVAAGADSAVLTVRDYGIGIAPADKARIFDRFERLVSVRQYAGFGLGLWIVRQVVEAHGGTIAVDSELGQGATFTVVLPLEAQAAEQSL